MSKTQIIFPRSKSALRKYYNYNNLDEHYLNVLEEGKTGFYITPEHYEVLAPLARIIIHSSRYTEFEIVYDSEIVLNLNSNISIRSKNNIRKLSRLYSFMNSTNLSVISVISDDSDLIPYPIYYLTESNNNRIQIKSYTHPSYMGLAKKYKNLILKHLFMLSNRLLYRLQHQPSDQSVYGKSDLVANIINWIYRSHGRFSEIYYNSFLGDLVEVKGDAARPILYSSHLVGIPMYLTPYNFTKVRFIDTALIGDPPQDDLYELVQYLNQYLNKNKEFNTYVQFTDRTNIGYVSYKLYMDPDYPDDFSAFIRMFRTSYLDTTNDLYYLGEFGTLIKLPESKAISRIMNAVLLKNPTSSVDTVSPMTIMELKQVE